MSDTIENQKNQIRELKEKLNILCQQKVPNCLSGLDLRSKEDIYSMDGGPSAIEAIDNTCGFSRIRDDIEDIEKDFNALGFGHLLQLENEHLNQMIHEHGLNKAE